MQFIKSTDGWLKWSVVTLILLMILFGGFFKDLFSNPDLFVDLLKIFYYGFFPSLGLWVLFILIFGFWVKEDEPKHLQVYKTSKLFELAFVCGMAVGYYIAFIN